MATTATPVLNDSLTARELEIVRLFNEGLIRTEIADSCDISVRTVDFHISNIYVKLNVHAVGPMLRVARDRGLIK